MTEGEPHTFAQLSGGGVVIKRSRVKKLNGELDGVLVRLALDHLKRPAAEVLRPDVRAQIRGGEFSPLSDARRDGRCDLSSKSRIEERVHTIAPIS